MQPEAAGSNAKQQIVDKIKQSTNILVAVSSDPSVDALAAAIGLTLLLNKLDKHATAVFSGEIPPAMQFLEPSKTLANSVDGLRDFIISLDKEKADRLRYKVENDVVRIFITPYRTTISEKDLQFSQGDFNVELIIALGVEKRDDLDKAIVAHGRILHDATVVTLNANNQQSGLGAIDWHDPNASSLCEMLIGVADGLQKPGVIDAQIATAMLTGLVASTERFSNTQTTPRVMTLAAQMMAAGANQQLIANNIQTPVTVPLEAPATPADRPAGKDGEISIKHPKEEKPKKAEEVKADELKKAEEELAKALPHLAATEPAGEPTLDQLKDAIKEETVKEAPAPQEAAQEPELKEQEKEEKSELPSRKFIAEEPSEGTSGADSALTSPESSWRERRLEPPTMGGTFTATSEQAMADKAASQDEDRNKKILTHGEGAIAQQEALAESATPVIPEVTPPSPAEPIVEPSTFPNLPPLPPIDVTPPEPTDQVSSEPEQPPQEGVVVPPVDIDAARQAVDAALAAQPFNPAGNPLVAVGAQPLSDVTPSEPFAPQPVATPAAEPPKPASTQVTPGAVPVIPPMPQLPVSEPGGQFPPMPPALPDLPPQTPPPTPPSAFDVSQPPEPAPNDPAQYKIPGQ